MRLLTLALLSLLSASPLAAQITTESESNNAESNADGPLGSGTTVNATIGSRSDIDWYYFDVVGSGNINISLMPNASSDFDFFLYKPTGSYVLSGQSSARPETGTYAATGSLRYTLKVTRYSGTGSYTLNVTYPGGISPTPTPTATPTPTPTGTPAGTLTPTPTVTPSPSPTSTGPGPRPSVPSGLTTYIVGSSADSSKSPVGGPTLLFMGGGADVDAAFVNRAFPVCNGGDVVVIRATGTGAYNSYLYNLTSGSLKPDSVETLIIDTTAKANTAYVKWVIDTAEFVFIAGGDQSTYVHQWGGTSLVTAMNNAYNRGIAIGGTSAGDAVLGQFIYDPYNVSAVTSSEAIANPYISSMIISNRLFNFPLGNNIITDTHFAARDRMGRSMAFMARLRQDGRTTSITNICVDEGTCLSVDRNGIGRHDGAGAVYVLTEDATTSRVQVTSGAPLIYNNVLKTKLTSGGTYNFVTGTGSTAATRLSVNGTNSSSPFTPTNPY